MFQKISFLLIALLSFVSFSQDHDEMPASVDEVIKWNFAVECTGDGEATIVITVSQKDHWHIYAQEQPAGGISQPTAFFWPESEDFKLIGGTKEYGAKEVDNDGYPEKTFPGDKAKFKQKIKFNTDKPFSFTLGYEFMACKTVCFPPTFYEVNIKINPSDCASSGAVEEETTDETVAVVEVDEDFQLDSSLAFLNGTCEGFEYEEIFDPVRVYLYKPQRTDQKNYALTTKVEIDSLFAMYAFNNPTGYKSIYTLEENEAISEVKPYNLTLDGVVGEKDTTGYRYVVTIKQNIELKDTSNVPVLAGSLDIYLMGCDNNFHNKENTALSFDLPNALDNGTRTEKDSLWLIFFLAFASGFIALLTPCVFPMIPMTVTFFTKQSKTKAEGIRKATLYAVSIIVIYMVMGVAVAGIFGGPALNAMATNPIVNIVFFAMFVIFAISFLGAFEITLPNSWINKADKQADKGGLIGIFFMAFTLALVSFSCTGPIVGTVLVQSAEGGFSGPIVAMFGFSLALALPFWLFAAFPGWLNSMPQSGGWLNTVKVTLGFLELAFALKFLSNADLVKQWHFLEREMFLAIWIGIFIMLVIYLLGKIRFPHDSPMEKLSVGRGLFAMIVLCFVIYLIPGLWGAPLKVIAGFPPPATYSEAPYGIHGEVPEVPDGWPPSTKAHGHGIYVVTDYNEALEFSKQEGKPLLIDFTGWACVNCRKMEENVWVDSKVLPLMTEEFIIASLYVDDLTELPSRYNGERGKDGELFTTVGDKWMDFQVTKYKEVTQPMYVVVDGNENNVSGKANYQTHSDPVDFQKWLEVSIKKYEASKNAVKLIPEFELVK